LKVLSALITTLVLYSSLCWAQNAPLSQEQLNARYDELVAWLNDYNEWEEWIAVNGNRPARTMLSGPHNRRKQRPEPPAWLSDDCAQLIGNEGRLGQACEILRQWHGLAPHLQQTRRGAAVTTTSGVVNDRIAKSSFWRRAHLTGLWAPTQIPTPPMFGVVGMQMGVVEVGRVTFPALGVMLVTVTGDDGARQWKPATNVSVSFRLCNLELYRHTAMLHFNVSRLIVHGMGGVGPTDLPVNLNVVGLSLSFKN
jgi:hypothetical protein